MSMNQNFEHITNKWIPEEEAPKKITSATEFANTAHDSRKFNIVVEGETDVDVYEQLIALIGIQDVDCYYAGNREELFKIYYAIKYPDGENKDKYNGLLNRVAFIADQDSWVFLEQKPPKGYDKINMDDIIWTDGYSMENDLYVKGNLRKLVRENYQDDYNKTVESICTWYAFQVNHSENLEKGIDARSLEKIVPHDSLELSEELLQEIRDAEVEVSSLETEKNTIEENYQTMIKGKTLFDLLARFLNKCGFPVNYGKKSFGLLVRIAITFSPAWSSSFKTELEAKLPDLKSSKKSLGVVNKLVERHHHDGVVNTIKELIKENSNYNKEVEGDLELGCTLERLSQYDAAIKFIEKAIKTNPKDPRAYTILSKCYLEKNMIDEAKDALAQLEQILMEVSGSNA